MYNRNEVGCPQMLVVQSSTDKEEIESPPNYKEDDQDNKSN